jgi:hypothetical protein
VILDAKFPGAGIESCRRDCNERCPPSDPEPLLNVTPLGKVCQQYLDWVPQRLLAGIPDRHGASPDARNGLCRPGFGDN